MKKIVKSTSSIIFAFSIPFVVNAQSTNFTYLNSFFGGFDNLIKNYILPLLMALAVLFFVWNVLRYFIWSADDPNGRETARIYIIYALLGLVFIVAVWGFVELILRFLGIGGLNNTPSLPRLP